ncbi:head completion/stabilization protein [Neisseria sp. S1]|uniref:head completion/stabilization protein n=1 Tax=Neisseria sp. S1 TaxID=3318354 RepID=UPI003A873BBB
MKHVVFAENTGRKSAGTAKNMIYSGSFWPIVDLSKMRQEARITDTVTASRLYYAATAAVAYVNAQLAEFAAEKEAAGISSLSGIGGGQINGIAVVEHHYLRAVYSYTKSELLETYADYDATGKTAERAEAKQEAADDYRREAHAAIADIKGRRRVDSELI